MRPRGRDAKLAVLEGEEVFEIEKLNDTVLLAGVVEDARVLDIASMADDEGRLSPSHSKLNVGLAPTFGEVVAEEDLLESVVVSEFTDVVCKRKYLLGQVHLTFKLQTLTDIVQEGMERESMGLDLLKTEEGAFATEVGLGGRGYEGKRFPLDLDDSTAAVEARIVGTGVGLGKSITLKDVSRFKGIEELIPVCVLQSPCEIFEGTEITQSFEESKHHSPA